MDRGSVLSGAAFRAVALSALLFLAVLIGAGFLAIRYVRSEMLEQTRNLVLEEELLLRDVYRLGGVPAVVGIVRDISAERSQVHRVQALYASTGVLIAGRAAAPPLPEGWYRMEADGGTVERSYLLHATQLGSMTLVTGESLDLTRTAETTLLRAMGTAGGVIILTMLATGYLFSTGSLRKLDAMEATLDRVAAGDLRARLTVSDENDQIDRVAQRMNRHLDRLTDLVERKDRTAAAIAHDLRTPLARATLGLGQARRQAEKGGDPGPAIDDVTEELARLGGVIGTILRISRIEAAGRGQGFARFELAPVLADLCDTYAPLAEDNGQSLTCDAGDARLFGDAQMVAQLVANLIQNAVSHAGFGADISVTAQERADGAVDLVVADTGHGMPAADRARAFEAFFRADRSRSTEGTGLGLALVRAIAEHHGAAIALEDNAPGLAVRVVFPPG